MITEPRDFSKLSDEEVVDALVAEGGLTESVEGLTEMTAEKPW